MQLPIKYLLFTAIFTSIIFKTHSAVIICYFASWSVYREGSASFAIEDIDPFVCTHLIYSFIGLNPDGTIRINDEYTDIQLGGFEKFTALKNANPQLKTLVAIGGGDGDSRTFSDVAANPDLRSAFLANTVDFLRAYNFDGLDFDWEYPAQNGGAPEDKQNFATLLGEFRAAFDGYGYTLTAAVAAYESSVDLSYDVPALSTHLHYINLMTYDFHGPWQGITGINAPMYASSADVTPIQLQLNVYASVNAWLARGADAQKLVLGLAAYGNSFTLANPNDNYVGATSVGPGLGGPFTRSPGTLTYYEICYYQANEGWSDIWSYEQEVPYSYRDDQWVGYDNARSIEVKVNFGKSMNLAGYMLWTIDIDDPNQVCGVRFPVLTTVHANL